MHDAVRPAGKRRLFVGLHDFMRCFPVPLVEEIERPI
jgi:hypothetical protein